MCDKIDDKIRSKYEILASLGKGAYGDVYRAINKTDGKLCALKKLYGAFRNQTDAQRTYREIKYLSKLDHPHIVKLKDCQHSIDCEDVYLELELLRADLASLIKRNTMPLQEIPYIFCQIASAVLCLHENQLLHRDIKPSNILIGDDFEAKLCDFGHVRSIGRHSRRLSDDVSTRWYKAPEILLGCKSYGKEIDMWGLGCTLAEMCLGKPVFPGTSNSNQLEIIYEITTGISLSQVAPEKMHQLLTLAPPANSQPSAIKDLLAYCQVGPAAIDLLEKLLRFAPADRLTIEEVLDHPFLEQARGRVPITSSKVAGLSEDKEIEIVKLPVFEYRRLVKQMEQSIHNEIQEISFVESPAKASSRCPSPKKVDCSKHSPKKRRTVCYTMVAHQDNPRNRTNFFESGPVSKHAAILHRPISPLKKIVAENRFSFQKISPCHISAPSKKNKNFSKWNSDSKKDYTPYLNKFPIKQSTTDLTCHSHSEPTFLKIPSKTMLQPSETAGRPSLLGGLYQYRSPAGLTHLFKEKNQPKKVEMVNSLSTTEEESSKLITPLNKSFKPELFKKKKQTKSPISRPIDHVPSFLLKKKEP